MESAAEKGGAAQRLPRPAAGGPRAKLPIVAFLAFFSAIAVSGSFYLSNQIKAYRQTKQYELTAIADLKAGQISNWYADRMKCARVIFSTPAIQRQAMAFLDSEADARSRQELSVWMESVRSLYGFKLMALYGADGAARTLTPPGGPADDLSGERDFQAALQAKGVLAGDLRRDRGRGAGEIHLDIMIPVGAPQEPGAARGVLLLRIDPYRFLYPLVQSWPTPSRTAETLLVRQEGDDVLFLNELRHRPDSALNLRLPMNLRSELAATQAIQGREGIIERADYRGVPTLAAMRRVGGTPWFMVAKMDTDEIYAPLRQRSRTTIALLFALTVAAALGIALRERKLDARRLGRQLLSEQEANLLLEKRVLQRTAALSEANDRLCKEIGERNQAREQLQEQHLFLSSIISNAGEGLCVCHALVEEPHLAFSLWNERMQAITGYGMEEINRGGWYRTMCGDAEQRRQAMRQMDRVWRGEDLRAEPWQLHCADGERRTVLATTSTVGVYRGIAHTLVLIQDVTAQKQLEAQLSAAKKMEAIGQLAGGVAHEVRNPLNAILSITEALFREKELADNAEFEPYVLHIRTQVRRLARLMNDLLDLGKPMPCANLRAVPLYKVCLETAELWKASATASRQQVTIRVAEQAQGVLVLADSARLEQVIFNLLENAAQHSQDDGEIAIDLQYAAQSPAGGKAVVRIADGGKGVPADKIDRIFEPFFTGRTGGAGLGLTLTRHFVEAMGGSVELWNNDPPPGCSVAVRIPALGKEEA